jgi:hypothetical protein
MLSAQSSGAVDTTGLNNGEASGQEGLMALLGNQSTSTGSESFVDLIQSMGEQEVDELSEMIAEQSGEVDSLMARSNQPAGDTINSGSDLGKMIDLKSKKPEDAMIGRAELLKTKGSDLSNQSLLQEKMDLSGKGQSSLLRSSNPENQVLSHILNGKESTDKQGLVMRNGPSKAPVNQISSLNGNPEIQLVEKGQSTKGHSLLSNDDFVRMKNQFSSINPEGGIAGKNNFKASEGLVDGKFLTEQTTELNRPKLQQHGINKFLKQEKNNQIIKSGLRNQLSKSLGAGSDQMRNSNEIDPVFSGAQNVPLNSAQSVAGFDLDISSIDPNRTDLIVNKIGEYLRLYRPSNGEMKLDIMHQDLGKIEINLKDINNKLEIAIETQSKEALDILKNSGEQLTKILKGSGIVVSELSIELGAKFNQRIADQHFEKMMGDQQQPSEQSFTPDHQQGEKDSQRRQYLWNMFNQGAFA